MELGELLYNKSEYIETVRASRRHPRSGPGPRRAGPPGDDARGRAVWLCYFPPAWPASAFLSFPGFLAQRRALGPQPTPRRPTPVTAPGVGRLAPAFSPPLCAGGRSVLCYQYVLCV